MIKVVQPDSTLKLQFVSSFLAVLPKITAHISLRVAFLGVEHRYSIVAAASGSWSVQLYQISQLCDSLSNPKQKRIDSNMHVCICLPKLFSLFGVLQVTFCK